MITWELASVVLSFKTIQDLKYIFHISPPRHYHQIIYHSPWYVLVQHSIKAVVDVIHREFQVHNRCKYLCQTTGRVVLFITGFAVEGYDAFHVPSNLFCFIFRQTKFCCFKGIMYLKHQSELFFKTLFMVFFRDPQIHAMPTTVYTWTIITTLSLTITNIYYSRLDTAIQKINRFPWDKYWETLFRIRWKYVVGQNKFQA